MRRPPVLLDHHTPSSGLQQSLLSFIGMHVCRHSGMAPGRGMSSLRSRSEAGWRLLARQSRLGAVGPCGWRFVPRPGKRLDVPAVAT